MASKGLLRYAHSEGHTDLCYDDTGEYVLQGLCKMRECGSAGADTSKMRETVWVISRILHMVNGDPSQGKS